MYKVLLIIIFSLFSNFILAESNIDQWIDSEKTYKDLIEEGYEVKSYDSTSLKTNNGLTILMFVTVLQKNKKVFECQEYQTLDNSMQTLSLSVVCKELTQPYQRGIGT
tara:strand:+ start:5726 stop:6049 length:324 start_codon:yes stop_codon:yes gene_type:complete